MILRPNNRFESNLGDAACPLGVSSGALYENNKLKTNFNASYRVKSDAISQILCYVN